MTSFLTDLAKPYVEKLINGAIAESSYICCFTCIAKDFEEERARLEIERSTVKQRIDVATRRGEDVQANVLSWEEEADKLIEDDTKTNQKCFFGFCPHCIWRYRRGKELANKKEHMKKLLETGKELAIGLPACLPDVERYSSQHFISFKSRESKYIELLNVLKDDDNYIIGLQGMGGTGKTTLVKEVGKKLKQSKQFTQIIDTTVSFSPDIKRIQDDIAGPLGLKFDDCNESDRPKKLWSRLTNGEKILLILDDVWGDIDFNEIGIPYSDNHKGCRILVTTRNLLVCTRLGCSKTIHLDLLCEEDAWIMFQKHAGLSKISTKYLLEKGRKIANECKRLPVAIAVIASSLKGERQEEWDVALNSLQKHMSMHGDDDELLKIYKCLRVSYDNMKNEKAKRLFLMCSVFREDEEISIEMLTRFGIGAGLFGEDYGSYEDARSQVVISKNKLLDSCLLLEANQSTVKMHDLVRDAAQWIANKEIQTVKLYEKNQKAMVEKKTNIKYLLCEGKVKDVFSLNLDGSKLEILIVTVHKDEDCHDVKIEVPKSFFENSTGLRVFHLTFDHYPNLDLSLPRSIHSLKNIRSLLFARFDLGDISILENLQSLETLDLEKCKIDELPHGIKKLEKLKLLNLKYCKIARNNPFEVIEGCSSLEELYFIASFNDFCREITFPKLKRFCIRSNLAYLVNSASSPSSPSSSSSSSKCLSLEERGAAFLSETTLKYCMQEAEVLRLSRIEGGWRNIIPEIVPMDQGMNHLVELELRYISQLQCLIDTKHIDSHVSNVFSKLVVLYLWNLENLVELCNGTYSFDSLNSLEDLFIKDCKHLQSLFKSNINLCNLKSVSLKGCPMLTSVFQLSTAVCLVSLERLEIEDCGCLECIIDERKGEESRGEIVYDDNDNTSHGSMFQKLKVLSIEKCPRFELMLPSLNAHGLPELESITVKSCAKLKGPSSISENSSKPQAQSEPIKCKIFSWTDICCCGKKYGQKLRSTTSTKIPLVSQDQPQDNLMESNSFSLQNLTELKIMQCEKLKIVFSTSIIRCLPQLRQMRIEECKELKHIIEDDLENKKSSNLMSIMTCFPKLKVLAVVKCNKLKYVFPISICKELPELKVLVIIEADELEEIFVSEGSDQNVNIPNLKYAAFVNLPSLCHAQGIQFQAVKNCFIRNCQKLSLASTSTTNFEYDLSASDFRYDFKLFNYLKTLFQQLQKETKGHDSGNENPSPETSKDFADGVEVKASSEHELTSPKELMNEKSMDQQRLVGETDTAVKPSQVSEISVEDGTTSANAKTIKSLQEYGDGQIAISSPPISITRPLTTQDVDVNNNLQETSNNNDDQVSLNEDAVIKVTSIVEEQFSKDVEFKVPETKPSPIIPSPQEFQTPSMLSKGNPSQNVEDSSSSLLVKSELEQLVSNNHLDYENLSLLTGFLVKNPSVRLKDTSLRNRYKGCAYNLLGELLKFLETHSVMDVLGSCHSEFVELLLDARNFGFDKDWLDGVERRILFPEIQVSQDALQKLLDSKQQVTKDVEVLRLKIGILSQHEEDLKQQLTSSESVLESIIQQEAVLSAPIGY